MTAERSGAHEVEGGRERTFCAQCFGKEWVRINGKQVVCTCVTWTSVSRLQPE